MTTLGDPNVQGRSGRGNMSGVEISQRTPQTDRDPRPQDHADGCLWDRHHAFADLGLAPVASVIESSSPAISTRYPQLQEIHDNYSFRPGEPPTRRLKRCERRAISAQRLRSGRSPSASAEARHTSASHGGRAPARGKGRRARSVRHCRPIAPHGSRRSHSTVTRPMSRATRNHPLPRSCFRVLTTREVPTCHLHLGAVVTAIDWQIVQLVAQSHKPHPQWFGNCSVSLASARAFGLPIRLGALALT